MHNDEVDKDKSILVPYTFNNIEIVQIEHQGKPVFLAQQVGAALGYSEPSKLAKNIAEKWSGDFEEGRDFIKLVNGTLAAFKAAMNQVPNRDLVDPRASHLILLTESGAQLAAILSRTAQGRTFRRWLLDVVLPQWRAQATAPSVPAPTFAERPKLITKRGKLTAKDVLRLNFRDPAEQLVDTVYSAYSVPNPMPIDDALGKPGVLVELMTGLVLRMVRQKATPEAVLLVAELAKVLGRPLPEVAADAPPKEIPYAQARVLLDGAPEHLLLHGLLTLDAIHSALTGPWIGQREEAERIAKEMFELHARITHKRDRWQRDFDHTVEDLERAMKTHPDSARLLAMVVRGITDHAPERWMEMFVQEQRRPASRRLTSKEVA